MHISQFQCPIHYGKIRQFILQLPIIKVRRPLPGIGEGKCQRCQEEQEIPIEVVQQEYQMLAHERIRQLEKFKKICEKQLNQFKDQFVQIRKEMNLEFNKIIEQITNRINELGFSMNDRIKLIMDQSKTIKNMVKYTSELKTEKKTEKKMYEKIEEVKNKKTISDSVDDFTKLITQFCCLRDKLKLDVSPETEKNTNNQSPQFNGANEKLTSFDVRKKRFQKQTFGQTGSQIFSDQKPKEKLPFIEQKKYQLDKKAVSVSNWRDNIEMQKMLFEQIQENQGRFKLKQKPY